MAELEKYGSDIVVDALKAHGIEYVTLNPGASFRGIHDSLVNYAGNSPKIILCPHEETSVAIAHGYAKATGRPMAAICHNVVGLMHATMAIYNAYADRVPVLVLGGTGPMDTEKRRPWIDWVHTALVQGNIVRGFVKWDDQPASIEAFGKSLSRAYSIATAEPPGPVYICYDSGLQEAKVNGEVKVSGKREQSLIQGDLERVPEIGNLLLYSESPIIVAGRVGRSQKAVDALVQLANACSVGVYDTMDRFNFPNTHSLDVTGTRLLESADFILSLDTRSVIAGSQFSNTRMGLKEDEAVKKLRKDAKIVSVGLEHLSNSSLIGDNMEFEENHFVVSADTLLYLPHLTNYCKKKISEDSALRNNLAERASKIKEVHDSARSRWRDQAEKSGGLSNAFIAQELWKIIGGRDWSLANGTLRGWARKLWEWNAQHNYYGDSGGAGLGYAVGASIGVALAFREMDRLVMCATGDGDFFMTCNGIWTAAHEKIPLLFLIMNNRAYGNDLEHQLRVARQRNRPEQNAKVGITIEDPPPDFSTLGKSLGCYSPGLVDKREKLASALEEGIKAVTRDRIPAVVDVLLSR